MEQEWPTLAEEVDREWLSTVLSAASGADVEVVSMVEERVGTGQVGECWRFSLEYATDTSEPPGSAPANLGKPPASVIVKVAATDPASRAAGQSQSCYRREVGFYRDLQWRTKVRTPHCYFAAIAANETDHVLVLEDMQPATQGDQMLGCNVDAAKRALEQLALLQAPLWKNESLIEIPWLERPSEENSLQLRSLIGSVCGGFLDRYAGRLSVEADQVVRWVAENIDAMARGEPILCPVHGDFRVDNLLFGDGLNAPHVTVVDWQTIKVGSGPRDAAYFLGGGLKASDRRTHEPQLVEEVYYRTLVEQGVEDLSFEECWHEYRLGTFNGLLMAVIASMLVGTTERGDEMFLTMARRHAQHVLDLDCQSLVPTSR